MHVTSSPKAHASHPAGRAPPPVVINFIDPDRLDALIDDLNRSHFPPGTPLYIGSYSFNSEFRDKLKRLKGFDVHYTPGMIFKRTVNAALWDQRPAHVKTTPQFAKYAGAIPKMRDLPLRDARDRAEIEHWGMEMGMRLRDKMRANHPSSWSFDEIASAASQSTHDGRKLRAFLGGILKGLHRGRLVPQENGRVDPPLKGVVHTATLRTLLAAEPRSDVDAFLKTLDQTTAVVTEEVYPTFNQGSVADAVKRYDLRDELLQHGQVGRNLAAKLVVMMTPGHRKAYHGAYDDHLSDAQVDEWRRKFMMAEANSGAAGLGEFAFTDENIDDPSNPRAHNGDVMRRVIAELAAAARRKAQLRG
ncbi:MAG: hypothetical protein IPJ65_37255 [Archangiaceae bacterium]|nr:hypothetical protein [Archangiaceae bacterium]